MGISVFMFCPSCFVFLPLHHRDPVLCCDVESEPDWGEGAFSLSVGEVIDEFATSADFFPATELGYTERLRTAVCQFAKDHAHPTENRVYFTNSYGIYLWEPGSGWQQREWWLYQEIAVMDGELPNELPSHIWTLLPSHIVSHLSTPISFDEALNYLVSASGWGRSTVKDTRSLGYFRQFYEGVIKWSQDLGGKLPLRRPRPANLVDHCMEVIRTCEAPQLAALSVTQLPDQLAQSLWHALSKWSQEERDRMEEEDPDFDFGGSVLKRFQVLCDMFGRSLTRLVITPAILDVFDSDEVLNQYVIRVASLPECPLRELEVTLAGNDWEEGSEAKWPSLCALKTLTMVLVRCLRPDIERWSLVSCGALTDEFLLPLDAIDEGPFVDDLLDKDAEVRTGGLRSVRLPKEDQVRIRELMARLKDSAETNLRGPYGLEELDVSNCHRLTVRVTEHLHELFPRLARLHLNDLTFLPFHSLAADSGVRLEHLVELNMAASYYPHEQERDERYFERLAAVCPRLEALNVSFWGVTDRELDTIMAHFPHLRRLNVIGSPALTSEGGLAAVGRHLASRGRAMDEINVGGCPQLASLDGLEMVRRIKAVGAKRLGALPLWRADTGAWAVEEIDLTVAEGLKNGPFLGVLSEAKTLKTLNVSGCFRLHKSTVIQAAKDHPRVRIVSSGGYQQE